jgi:hypothetical protein
MPFKSYMANLSLLGLVLQALLILVLLAKKAWGKFPFFFAYSAFSLIVALTLYLVHGYRAIYFYVYYSCEGIGLLLGFGVVYEIFRKLLFPYPVLRRVANCVFPAAIAVFVLLATIVVYAQSSGEQNKLMAGVLIAEEAVRIVELGMLMFLFIFSSAFGLHWKQSLFGITLGLGLFIAVELIAVTIRTHLGVWAADSFGVARLIAFNTSLVIWMGYLMAPERATSSAEVPKRAQLEQWNEAVMELISK